MYVRVIFVGKVVDHRYETCPYKIVLEKDSDYVQIYDSI